MGQSSSGEVSVQTQDPWGAQQPYLQDLFRLAQGMYTGRVYDYPNQSSVIRPPDNYNSSRPPVGPPASTGGTPADLSPAMDQQPTQPGGRADIAPALPGSYGEAKTPTYGQIPPELSNSKTTDALSNTAKKIESGLTWTGNKIGEGATWVGNKIGDLFSKAGPMSLDDYNQSFLNDRFRTSGPDGYYDPTQTSEDFAGFRPFDPGIVAPNIPGRVQPPTNGEQVQNRTGATGLPSSARTNPMPYVDWAGKEGINIPTPQFATIPGVNPAQQNFMQMLGGAGQSISPYSGLAASALAGQLNPWSNPYQRAAMSTLGSQTGALQSILGGGMAPGATYAPNIGYGVTDPMAATFGGGANNANLYGTIDRMMTGTPNMGVWGPLMQQSASNAARAFNEQVMPAIRSESISAGAYGGPKHQQAMGLAAGRLGEQIMAGQSGLAKEAAMAALGQQQAGAGLGSQLAQTGGQLNLGAQQLGGDIAKTQAQLGLQSQLGNQGAWNQYLDTLSRTAGMAGNLAGQAYQTGTSGINQAAAGMPQALQSILMPANIQGQLGDYMWNLEQQQIKDKLDRFNRPYDMLARYGQMVTGQYGGTTSTPVQGKSPLASALGGAALGGSFGGPWGAAGGGLAGLLGLL